MADPALMRIGLNIVRRYSCIPVEFQIELFMCEGHYLKDPLFAASHRERFKRQTAAYLLRDRYRRIAGKDCAYCGFEAETGDHVPSLFAGYTNGVVAGVLVPVCSDCNQHLGAFSSTCFKERLVLLSHVYDQLATKNQGFASSPTATNPKWRIRAETFKEKAARCRKRQGENSCYMLDWK